MFVLDSSALLSDFMVKVVEVSDSSQQKMLRGHEAPVLSVAFDPKDDFLVDDPLCWNIKVLTAIENLNYRRVSPRKLVKPRGRLADQQPRMFFVASN